MDREHIHTREESGIRLDAEGRWFHDGDLIQHPKVLELFNRSVRQADDGRYLLTVGDDWCFITVEDAPLQVLEVSLGDDQIKLKLSDGCTEVLHPESLSIRHGALYCASERGMLARFSRSAQFALGILLEEHDDHYVLRLGWSTYAIDSNNTNG